MDFSLQAKSPIGRIPKYVVTFYDKSQRGVIIPPATKL